MSSNQNLKEYKKMDSKKNQTSAVSMTEGSLWKNIFLFSCPLIFSQLLEVMFNLSDVAVVGRFADYRALGSVGSTSLLVTLFIGFLIGMGAGVNVRVAHGLGAGNQKETEETIHSSFLICLVTGLLICVVGLTSSRAFLALLHTKDELMEGAVNYLQIYSLGMPAMGLYNFGNGVMSARGDTKRPLVYLLIAGVLNVIMNLIFVIGFHMAAEGVAIASVMAQYTSAGLVLHHLWRRRDVCRLQLRKVCFHRVAGKAVLMLGIPGGLQQAIFAIANLFVQAGVNSFDAVTVSGNAAAANTDPLVYNSMFAFYTACASFMSRNLGAGKKERVLKSYFICLTYAFSIGAVLGGFFFLFGDEFLSLFATEPAVIHAGKERLSIMAFSYAISAFMDCSIAASRGIGKSVAPTVIVILGSCVFRVIWVFTIFAHFHTLTSLYLLYAFSWIITGAAEVAYFWRSYRRIPNL